MGRLGRALRVISSRGARYRPPKTFLGGVPIEVETRPIWTNALDEYTPPVIGEYGRATKAGEKTFKDVKATLWRWRDDFQNDFAARMEWTTKSYREANHPPVAVLNHPDRLTVHSGESFGLDGGGTDPDGDSVSFFWFQYPEAGTYKRAVCDQVRRKHASSGCGGAQSG